LPSHVIPNVTPAEGITCNIRINGREHSKRPYEYARRYTVHTYQVEREPKGEYSKPSAATAVRQFILDRNDFPGSRCLAHANNHAHHSRQLDLEKGKYRSSATASFLSLLLDCAARRCTRPAVDGLGTATTALLFCGALVVITAVIVVVVNLHLARCRLIHWCRLRRRCALLFLPWSRRHAWW
jgi:hypothetical protein